MTYIVTGIVKGKRKKITKPSTKQTATLRKKRLQKNMQAAIPKYKWVKSLKVEKG